MEVSFNLRTSVFAVGFVLTSRSGIQQIFRPDHKRRSRCSSGLSIFGKLETRGKRLATGNWRTLLREAMLRYEVQAAAAGAAPKAES
jgi:hypothetical protein